MRALYLQQMAAEQTMPSRGLTEIITYERPVAQAAAAPVVELSPAEILAAAAYNLILDARATRGDVLSLLKS